MRPSHLLAATTAFALSAVAQCPKTWLRASACPGTAGPVAASVLWDPDGNGPQPVELVIGGDFRSAGDIACDHLVRWQPTTGLLTAIPPPPGPLRPVADLDLLPTGALVVAFHEPTSGASNVATWDGSVWTHLGGDFQGGIVDLHVRPGGEPIASGWFSAAGGVSARGLARWTGSGWQEFAGGVSGVVHDLLELPNGDLVAGGRFAQIGGVLADNIARWNGTSWSPLGAGRSWDVVALARLPNGDLMVGSDGLSRWDGAAWHTVPGLSTTAIQGFGVSALHPLANGSLLVGGTFDTVAGQPSRGLAAWNAANGQWSTYGAGLWQLGYPSTALATLQELPNGGIFVGGEFNGVDTIDIRNAVVHDANGWRPLADGIPAGATRILALDGDRFVVSGLFRSVGSVPAHWIVEWDGAAWRPLGAGIHGSSASEDGIHDLLRMPNGDILVAGRFDAAGGSPVSGLARWDGSAWSALGSGVFTNSGRGTIRRLLSLPNGDVLAAGEFTSIGGVAARNIARWDGSVWAPLGLGVAYELNDMAMLTNGLLAVVGRDLATWDGNSWYESQYFGWNEVCRSIVALDNGQFVTAGWLLHFDGPIMYEPYLRFSSGAFVSLSWSSTDLALHRLPNGDLLVGGLGLNYYGNQTVPGLVRVFDPLNGGIDTSLAGGAIVQFAATDNGDLLALGAPHRADPGLYGVARLRSACPATATASGTGCAGSGGPNLLAPRQLPWLGASATAEVTGIASGSIAANVMGFSTTAMPLATLVPQGMPGCTQWVSADAVQFAFVAGSQWSTSLPIPNHTALLGVTLHQQVVLAELVAQGVSAITATNRLSLTVGWF